MDSVSGVKGFGVYFHKWTKSYNSRSVLKRKKNGRDNDDYIRESIERL